MIKDKKHITYQIKEGYRVPLKAIRGAITTVLSKDKNLYEAFCKHGCAIGFFRYKEENESDEHLMRMRIFHFNDKTLDKNLGKKQKFTKTVLSIISKKKGYSQFDHLNHFRKFYCTEDDDGMALYHLNFRQEDIITFCSKQETITFIDHFGKNETVTWSQLETDLKKTKSKYYPKYSKQLDHLIFSSGMKEVYIIPVPILSSPSILVFFNAAAVKQELQYGKKEIFPLIRDILWKVSDAVFFHLYNRLIVEFTEEPNSFIKLESIETEEELFSAFIKSVSQILLPVKYSIDNKDFIQFFDWYGNEEKSSSFLHKVSIDFSSKRVKQYENERIFTHKVDFLLPNYKVPVRSESNVISFEMRAAKTEQGEYLSVDYFEQENKFRLTLQNLYRLIFSYWEAIRKSKDFIANILQPSLQRVQEISDQINIGAFTNAVEKLNTNIDALTKGQISRPNTFKEIQSDRSISEYEFIFMNESSVFRGKSFYHFYDMMTSDYKSIEDLETFNEYSEGKKKVNDVNYESSKSQLIEWFDDLVSILKSTKEYLKNAYDKLTLNENVPSETFLDNLSHRDAILYYSVYLNKLNDIRIQLDKLFHTKRTVPMELNDPNIKNLINKIKNGDYADKIRTQGVNLDEKFNLQEVKVPKSRDFKKDYRTSLEKAINEIVTDHPKGDELKSLFIEASLVRERPKDGTLLVYAKSLNQFKRHLFDDWIF